MLKVLYLWLSLKSSSLHTDRSLILGIPSSAFNITLVKLNCTVIHKIKSNRQLLVNNKLLHFITLIEDLESNRIWFPKLSKTTKNHHNSAGVEIQKRKNDIRIQIFGRGTLHQFWVLAPPWAFIVRYADGTCVVNASSDLWESCRMRQLYDPSED